MKQRLSLLKRAKRKVNNQKMSMIADAIFQSKLRYGIAAYSSPKFEFNHLEHPMDPNLAKLQVVQNDMLRILNGKTRGADHTNMQRGSRRLLEQRAVGDRLGTPPWGITGGSLRKSYLNQLKV